MSTMSLPKSQRQTEQEAEQRMISADLRAKYLRPEVPDTIAADVFREAYERGHAAGWHEVEQEYDTLATLVNKAFKAGRA
jgi:hypothetical protein